VWRNVDSEKSPGMLRAANDAVLPVDDRAELLHRPGLIDPDLAQVSNHVPRTHQSLETVKLEAGG
jgi:hypothetical protein